MNGKNGDGLPKKILMGGSNGTASFTLGEEYQKSMNYKLSVGKLLLEIKTVDGKKD